jgi:hypothetical protein
MSNEHSTTNHVPEAQRRRSRISDALGQLGVYVSEVLGKLDGDPELVLALTDAELLALDAWTEGSNITVRAQCRQRQHYHQEQARRFTDRGDTDLVPVLAERPRF